MTDMIEVKTADLIGPALDWAVSKICGVVMQFSPAAGYWIDANDPDGQFYSPSTEWAQAGPLIEKFKVMITPPNDLIHRNFGAFDSRNGWYESGHWGSTIFGKERKYRRTAFSHPSSPLVVAMRAIVQFELGDAVQVPKELMPCEPES